MFRLCSKYLAQKLVCLESLAFVVRDRKWFSIYLCNQSHSSTLNHEFDSSLWRGIVYSIQVCEFVSGLQEGQWFYLDTIAIY